MAQEQPITPQLVPAQAQPLPTQSTPTQNNPGLADLQVDDDLEDDSAYAASEASASFVSSINSSVFRYKYENGRRYHAFREGAYLVPNDDEEQDRMDLAHHIYGLLLGGELHLAPIGDNPQRVLDLGTGTGIWAMDFADQYPSAEVIGTDLSPIQPKWTPPNCTFEVDDFEQDWVYRKRFDYIHARELGGCIADDGKLFSRAFEHLAPGGYLEMQAVYPRFLSDDDTGKLAKDAQYWMTNICEGAAKFGKPLDSVPQWLDKMQAAGFVEVKQEIRKIPFGSWPKDPTLKEIGRHSIIQENQLIDSYTPGIFSRVLGWDQTEIQVLMARVKNDLNNPAIHLYVPTYFIWGKKPEE
ncbi:hypothetical protein BFJ68_g17505 [Fusarium oxysporum]|uniref:Secondary metabolism regulator LAE1 n=1 Tax=Fusarium oxysporum TaxID=5507 RepID=A0A420NRD6_FUSOX|nr:hypothetical protein BFJ66_g14470 [Fusarium oxysporum f. sp. cepae]RKK82834.1 hypothetical protein BFJ68_g17505 [Fusarium oxysporum]